MPLAIVLHDYGPPEALSLERVERPPLAPGEIRVATLAAGVNRTDLEIRRGHWPIHRPEPFPYIPGIEVMGCGIERGGAVHDLALGDRVLSMMMGLGGVRAERPGRYQEEVVLPAAHCAKLPTDVSADELAGLGIAGVTALQGLSLAGAGPDRQILVSGASGGVGSCAVRIAKALGADVVALTREAGKQKWLSELGADQVLALPRAGAVQSALPAVDGVLDTVGGAGFGALVAALSPGRRLCCVGAAAGEAVSFSAWALLDEIVLTGWSSERLDGEQLQTAVATLANLLRQGRLRPAPVTRLPLAQAAAAHRAMAAGTHRGRLLLVPESAGSAFSVVPSQASDPDPLEWE